MLSWDFRLLILLGLGASASSCTSAWTSVTAPDAAKCQVGVSSAPASFPENGGAGALTIAAARDCTWSVATDSNWVSLGSTRNGQGDATVSYNVTANPAAAARSGSVTVGTSSVQLNQAAAACRYTLSQQTDTIGNSGGRLSVNLTTPIGCGWTAAPSASWITVASGQSGNASGTVTLTIAANGGAARIGQVNIAGQIYTVTEDGASGPNPAPGPTPSPEPSPSPSPSPPPAPAPTVHVDGKATAVFGSCPTVFFSVKGSAIGTDSSTVFKKGPCKDLSSGDDVAVDGVREGGGIRATVVELKKNEH